MDFSKYYGSLNGDFDLGGKVDEYKLICLYAYNEYYNADNQYVEETLNGICFDSSTNTHVDGVFINESLEEDTVEVLTAYYVPEEMTFDISKVFNSLGYISAFISDVKKNFYRNKNSKAEDLLKEKLDSVDNKNIIIKVITNAKPSKEEKFDINNRITSYSFSDKSITAIVIFGDDIVANIDSNKEPFDYVRSGLLVVDSAPNILKYNDNSFICNISAKSLSNLWELEGKRGLLAMNLRYYIKAAAIDDKISESIRFDYDNFWYLNNGIIIVCDDYNFIGNELRMTNFSIVNGGQTTRMIGNIPFDNDFFISCKVVKNTFGTTSEKNKFISKVAEASNTQKPIKIKDIIANRVEQRDLKSALQNIDVFIEIKRGEKPNKEIYKEAWQKTKNNELAQDLFSFVYLQPGPARNSVSQILQNDEKYRTIFKNHTYSPLFLKDLVVLEKAYKDYAKKIGKDTTQDPVKQGLVKNGIFYCLATIGYILKLAYNKEFKTDMGKYLNNKAQYDLYSPELAFSHQFIKEPLTFKLYEKELFKLFDYIFFTYLVPCFNFARENNETIVYSNWTKRNTGFETVRSDINNKVFNYKDQSTIEYVSSFFETADEEQENKNIDDYVDYCKKNPSIRKSRTSTGDEMNERDSSLRDELMLFRLTRSTEKHISELSVFTDKQLDKLIINKPINKDELKKIITNPNTVYYCGDDIVSIIIKYL